MYAKTAWKISETCEKKKQIATDYRFLSGLFVIREKTRNTECRVECIEKQIDNLEEMNIM